MAKKKANDSPTIENRKARFHYHITDTLECGIQLMGSEVKSVRAGKVSLAEGYVRAQSTPPGLFLHSISIDEYSAAGVNGHKLARTRTLLAHTREILKLARAVEQKGFTIVPLSMYFKNGYAKVLIGLGEGKAAHDKRQTIAKRDAERSIQRAMSRRDR